MTYRERVLRTMRFQEVDALPFRLAYGLMPGVLEDWHAEGLPSGVTSEADVHGYFGFPTRARLLPLNAGFEPPFPARVIEENAEFRIGVDSMGRTTKLFREYASIPLAIDFPVKDMATWHDCKRRLDFFPGRIGSDLESIVAENIATGHLNSFGTLGFYWFPRDLMGDENLCIAYYEQPELVRDILETWCGLLERILIAALERVRLDGVQFGEDMAYRNASMVGRAVFDDFIRPYYERIHRLVRSHGIPIFSVDSDGCLDQLVDWFSGCGVNLIGPNEVQAGNDIIAYRSRLGRRMGYDGGLDKRAMTRGRDAIEAMLEGVIPGMKDSGGGWIVSLDHRVLKGTPLADFQYFVDRVREMSRF